jgi:hypothetical protein
VEHYQRHHALLQEEVDPPLEGEDHPVLRGLELVELVASLGPCRDLAPARDHPQGRTPDHSISVEQPDALEGAQLSVQFDVQVAAQPPSSGQNE